MESTLEENVVTSVTQVPPTPAVPMKTVLIGGKDDNISLLSCPEESTVS